MSDNVKKEYKFKCDKCEYFTNAKSGWIKHINSGMHLEGHRAIRCDKKLIDKCPKCDYTTKNTIAMDTHILNNHSTNKERKEKFRYYCEVCDFGSFSGKHYKKHLETQRHKRRLA